MTDPSKKPITAAQAAARRENGKRYSTGPKTPEGKQASSRNARKHGLWSKADPVVDGGIFGEDMTEYEGLQEGVRASFVLSSILMEELARQLVSVLWRVRRIPAIEAMILQDDGMEDRLADRTREDIEEMLEAEAYLRAGGYELDEDRYLVVVSSIHAWAGWEYGEGWDVDDPAPPTEDERMALIDRLLRRRWETWEEAADHARAEAHELEERTVEALRLAASARARRLLTYEVLSKLNRPEAHLARERDRLLGQLRAEEARAEAKEDEKE